ncbi:Fis family transcriptional regulator [Lamprobacter modestohalophilus]|uniref:Fis family transcriptional regulator n=1 Tax=Lamprobacter modestohalophilus TaxID=1064514 RepID=UPI00190620B0|nr:Fis family transcriptional regulator [Lamprobacter modestohalophilus]
MSVRISGDFLALDNRIKRLINQQAQAIQASFPGRDYEIGARIAEEFDQLNGHRVRFELVVTSPERQQIIVREAQKKAEESIKSAFSSLKSKLRRIGARRPQRTASAPASLPAAST